MRKLIESTFVTLGGDIGSPQDWGPPYLDGPEQNACLRDLLFDADALLLGRKTYEGLSAGYTEMAAGEPGPMADFIARMNAIPKYVASTTLTELSWNASPLSDDVAGQVAALKDQPGNYLLKYGTGRLDAILLQHGLLDELRLWVIPVTTAPGQRLFEGVGDLGLELADVRRFGSGVVLLTYVPAASRRS
jgi:dihydrofolate reductase